MNHFNIYLCGIAAESEEENQRRSFIDASEWISDNHGTNSLVFCHWSDPECNGDLRKDMQTFRQYRISHADIAIAWLPTADHNTYYDMGIAYGYGIPVVAITSKRDQGKENSTDPETINHALSDMAIMTFESNNDCLSYIIENYID